IRASDVEGVSSVDGAVDKHMGEPERTARSWCAAVALLPFVALRPLWSAEQIARVPASRSEVYPHGVEDSPTCNCGPVRGRRRARVAGAARRGCAGPP